jgi:hypothetical protein
VVWERVCFERCIGQGGEGRSSPELLDDGEVAMTAAAAAFLDGGRSSRVVGELGGAPAAAHG